MIPKSAFHGQAGWAQVGLWLSTSAMVVMLVGAVNRLRRRFAREPEFTGIEKLDRQELDETDGGL